LQGILDFVDSGRNLVVGASSDVSDTIRALAAEVGIDLDEKGSKVWDHFNHVVLDGKADHATIAASDRITNPAIIDASASKVSCASYSAAHPASWLCATV
jgi:oligosaccharyltransferase complex subunit beta